MRVILDLRLYLQRYLVGKAELQSSKLVGNESETVDRVRNIFEYRPYKRRFREPLQTALGDWVVREGFILRLLDDQGVTGFGEVAPVPWLGSETLEDAEAFLSSAQSEGFVDAVPADLPCCRFAISCAHSVLRQDLEPPEGKAEVAGLLPAGHSALEKISELIELGFQVFKWKAGVESFAQEVEILDHLLDALPANGFLRIDANGGWNLVEAWRWLETLEGEDRVQFVEDPLESALWEASFGLAEAFETSLALDFPVTNERFPVLAEKAWPGLLVVKPSTFGSVHDLRGISQSFPQKVVFSSAFETAFGYEAVLRLAIEDGTERLALGLGGQDLFEEDGLNLHHVSPRLLLGEVGFDELEKAWEGLL